MRVPAALQESIPIAIGALRANKVRGALTTLGIIIGIVAVVLTMTAANGLQNKFRESFSSVGTDIIILTVQNPVEIAEQIATLDIMTGGRAIFGVGLGYRDVEFDVFGVNRKERADV